MLNVVNNGRTGGFKSLILAVIVMALPVVATSCGESAEEKAAKEMLAQVSVLMTQGDYEQALALVDTLPVMYPKQIKVRQAALDLKPAIIELATDGEIDKAEADIEAVQQRFADAREKMKRIDDENLVEGYWIPSSFKVKDFLATTGIQPRVTDDGSFNIVSEVNNAGTLHHSAIMLSASNGDKAESGAVPYDDELNYRINNSETVTFGESKVDSIGKFAVAHYGEPLKLTFLGENGKTKEVKLSAQDVSGIADAYVMGKLQKEGKALVAKHQLLLRKRDLAREQQKRRNSAAE